MGIRFVGRKQVFRSLEQNLGSVFQVYPIKDGFFGEKGLSKGVRVIYSMDPEKSAKDFFNRIGKGGILDLKTLAGGVLSRMKDGTIISYRKITSTVGSPAVEIRFENKKPKFGIEDQKIHFVKAN